jgi:hypothetical protein
VDTSSRYAVRSRFTGRAQCDRCGTADHAEYLAVKATVAAPRIQQQDEGTRATFDAGLVPCVRCGDVMLETMLSARAMYSGAAICEPCANGGGRDMARRPYPVTTPERSRAHAERAFEAWRARTPEQIEESEAYRRGVTASEWDEYMARGADPYEAEFYAQRTDASLYGTDREVPWEDRHQHDDDDDADGGYRFDAEARGYGPEPDGIAVYGKPYKTRWWAADPTSEVRDWVADVEWVLR